MNRQEVLDVTLRVLEKVEGIVGTVDINFDEKRFISTVYFIDGDTYTVNGFVTENSVTLTVERND